MALLITVKADSGRTLYQTTTDNAQEKTPWFKGPQNKPAVIQYHADGKTFDGVLRETKNKKGRPILCARTPLDEGQVTAVFTYGNFPDTWAGTFTKGAIVKKPRTRKTNARQIAADLLAG